MSGVRSAPDYFPASYVNPGQEKKAQCLNQSQKPHAHKTNLMQESQSLKLTATVAPFFPAPPVNILSIVPSDLNMEYSPQIPPNIVVTWFNEKKYS